MTKPLQPLFLFSCAFLFTVATEAQVNLSTINSPYTQNFSFKALKDDVKEKMPEGVQFTISSWTNGLSIGTQNSMDVTIVDVKAKKNPQFVVSPNPTSGIVNFVDADFDNDYNGTIQVTLRRANGFVIYNGSGSVTEVNAALGTALSHDHNGVYLLTVIAGDEISTIRLIKT